MMRSTMIPEAWGKDSFVFIRQPMYADYAASDAFPGWLRVTFAAYSRMTPNRHAVFGQGELKHLLGRETKGIWLPADRRSAYKAVQTAIDKRLLLPESKLLCLVVPHDRLAGGIGNVDAPCKRHPRPAKPARLRAVR